MNFEIIDNKKHCKKIFIKNSITDNFEKKELTSTWSYDPYLKDCEIEYGSIYAQGKTISDCCPKENLDYWNHLVSKHFAFQKSFKLGKVSLQDTCFYDLVPENFTLEFFNLKSKINEYVIQNFERPKNYDFLIDLSDLVYSIQHSKLNINLSSLAERSVDEKTKNTFLKFNSISPFIHYNIFGSVTGRLTTFKHSFPILNLNKQNRDILYPTNDLFVELDYNAAEFRSLLALAGIEQPNEDIHDFHLRKLKQVMVDEFTREQVKTRMFKWLYGGNVSLGISALEEIYNKDKILNKYWDGEKITNPYGREIECDSYHALSYLNQSFLSDLFLRKVIEIHKFLENRKSFVCWTIHDSVMIDLSMEDKELLPEIKRIFENTDCGQFISNVKVGKRFDQMKEF